MQRNLHAHGPALLAMEMYGARYASQNGGCMDFWDTLDDDEQHDCRCLARAIRKAPAEREATEAA